MSDDLTGLAVFVVIVIAIVGVYKLGEHVATNSVRQEAVDAGVAEYVFSDKYGKAEFRFKSATTAIERASQ